MTQHMHFLRIALLAMVLGLASCDYLMSPEARVERARAAISAGEHRRALLDLKNALQKEPKLHAGRLLLCEVSLWLGDATSARRELDLVPPETDPASWADLDVRVNLALGKFPAVIDRLAATDTLLAEPNRALYRGQALQALNRPNEAEQAFRTAVQLDPDLVAATFGIAETLVAQQQLPQALALSSELAKKKPDSALAWYLQGALLARSADFAGCITALQRARELAPRQLPLLRQIGVHASLIEALLMQGDVAGARSSLASLTRIAAGTPIAVMMSGRVAMAAGDYATATTELRRVLNGAPGLTQARFLLGTALAVSGNFEQAAAELSQVLEQSPENREARELLTRVRLRQEDPDSALRVVVPGLQMNAGDSEFAALASTARVQGGASGGTRDFLEESLKQTPDNRALQLQLAAIYLQDGSAAKAVELLRNAPRIQGDSRREAMLLQAVSLAEGQQGARREAAALLAANPDDPATISLAAAFYSHLGDADAGRAVLETALARQPRDPALLFARAQLERAAGKPAAARAALEQMVAVDPARESTRLALAELALERGDRAEAATQLETVRKQNLRAVEARLLLARLALAENDAKRAAGLVTEVMSPAPAQPEVFNSVGLLYFNAARYDDAIRHLHAGTEAHPDSAFLWLNLGRSHLALRQGAPAGVALHKAEELRPGWIPVENALTALDLQNNNQSAALDRVLAIRKARPTDPEALELQGDTFQAVGKHPEAAKAFQDAAAIRPSGDLAVKVYQARLLGGIDKPLETLELWVAEHPQDLSRVNLLAEGYLRTRQPEKALPLYERILEQQPRNVPVLNNLAWLSYELKLPRALELARRAHELAPQSSAVGDTLGWILAEQGKAAEALPILRNAAAAADATADVKYHYAAALARGGSKAEARAELERLLKDPAPFASRSAAQKLLADLGMEGVSGG